MHKEAYGTFVKKGGQIFRTEAKIKWGDSNKQLGLLIMLNPGSSKLKDEKEWISFKDGNKDVDAITGKIILDDTMKVVVDILEKSHPNLNGILIIQNLFNLRNSESKGALLTYKDLFDKNDSKLLANNFKGCINEAYRDVLHTEISEDYISKFPWIWLAWTVDDGKILNARRQMILNNIPEEEMRFVINSRQQCHHLHKELYAYHVCPRFHRDKEIYVHDMVFQMKEYWNNRKSSKKYGRVSSEK